jgi:hypothetical protein
VPTETAAAPIDWCTTMRDCVGGAAVLAGRIEYSDSDVGEALNRLCNVVAHLLDENKALAERVENLETVGSSLIRRTNS